MVEGGATGTDYSDQFIENIAKYIREKPDLVDNLRNLLKDNDAFKNLNKEFDKLSIEDVTNLLKNNKKVLDDVVKHFIENKKDLEMLLEQVNKVEGMEGKLEALGNQLLTQGVIGGAAITALTGALAGTLAIGGVAGALMGGGLALAGLVALVAIVAIGYAIYQYRGEIKEGALDAGKAIKSLVKDLIDKLPTFRARENNFAKLNSDLLEQHRKSTGEEQTKLNNKIEIIKMLQDKDQRPAIEKLVGEGEIKFPEMKKLIEKGDSTHETDKKPLEELMEKFLPEIMAISENDIKKVEEKVNEMKPKSQVDDPSPELASPEEEIKK